MKKKSNRTLLNWLFILLIALSGIGVIYLLFFQRRSTLTTPVVTANAAASVTATVTPAGTVLTVPGQVTGVSAAPSPGSILLNWLVPTGSAPTSYRVLRSLTGTPGSFTQIGVPVTNSFTDTDVTAGVDYIYQIIAVNAQGSGPASANIPATGAATVPGAVTGVTATASPGSTALVWNAPTTGTPPTGYKVMRRTGAGAYAQIGATIAALATSYNDTTGVAGTAYDYQIVATNAQGNGTASGTASATAQAATVPGAVTGFVVNLYGNMPGLNWNAPTTGSPATGYKVYRSASVGSGFVEVYDTTLLEQSDPLAPLGTMSYYKVVAYNANGNGPDSNVVPVTIP